LYFYGINIKSKKLKGKENYYVNSKVKKLNPTWVARHSIIDC
jgi:hypothetical protein